MLSKGMEYFMAVAECKSYAKAAQLLYVSPAAVTLQIKALEKRLGFRLFDRDNRGTRLTEAGAYFYEQIKGISLQLDKSAKIAKKTADAFSSKLTVGIITSESFWVLPFFCRKYRERYPQRELHFVQINDADVITALNENHIDLCLRFGLETESYECLKLNFIYRIQLFCLIPSTHPLAKREEIHLADLAGETMMLPVTGQISYYDELRKYLSKYCPMLSFKNSIAVDSALITMKTMNCLSVCPCLNEPLGDDFVVRPFYQGDWDKLISLKLLYREKHEGVIDDFFQCSKEALPELIEMMKQKYRPKEYLFSTIY